MRDSNPYIKRYKARFYATLRTSCQISCQILEKRAEFFSKLCLMGSSLFLLGVGIDLLHNLTAGLPSAGFFYVGVTHDIPGGAGKEVPELVKRERREAEIVLQGTKINVYEVRRAIVHRCALRKLPDEIRDILGDVDRADRGDCLTRFFCPPVIATEHQSFTNRERSAAKIGGPERTDLRAPEAVDGKPQRDFVPAALRRRKDGPHIGFLRNVEFGITSLRERYRILPGGRDGTHHAADEAGEIPHALRTVGSCVLIKKPLHILLPDLGDRLFFPSIRKIPEHGIIASDGALGNDGALRINIASRGLLKGKAALRRNALRGCEGKEKFIRFGFCGLMIDHHRQILTVQCLPDLVASGRQLSDVSHTVPPIDERGHPCHNASMAPQAELRRLHSADAFRFEAGRLMEASPLFNFTQDSLKIHSSTSGSGSVDRLVAAVP